MRYDAMRREALAIKPQIARRIRALAYAEHSGDHDDSMFRQIRPMLDGQRVRSLDPDTTDRVLRLHVAVIGLGRDYSAHSIRATFTTTTLKNGAELEDVQKAAGYRDPSTTKLYDRRD